MGPWRVGAFAPMPHFPISPMPLCLEETQSDGRIRRWARISAANNKYLRVVLLEDGETVHNAFFDRSFKEGDE